jgi:hypothetical protein
MREALPTKSVFVHASGHRALTRIGFAGIQQGRFFLHQNEGIEMRWLG